MSNLWGWSGLNFLKNESIKNKQFLLICGFENFDKFFIRVDILERFFLQVIENSKDGVFKINSDMINLIGCNKENFLKLLELMQYKPQKTKEKNEELFKYIPKFKKNNSKKINKNDAFSKLSELRLR